MERPLAASARPGPLAALAHPCAAPYWAWSRIRNIGDAITPYLLRRLGGCEPLLVADRKSPHLLATGSILHFSTPQSHVWGSGALAPGYGKVQVDPRKVRAVRGTRTLADLRARGFAIGDVPLGDPGILVDRLDEVRTVANRPPRFAAALVLHHSQSRSPLVKRYAGSAEVKIVDMIDASLQPILDLAECEVVLSQSLHGLIFAEAIGRPSLWISTSDEAEWCFKFTDWFTTTANPQAAPNLFSGNDPLDDLFEQAEPRHSTIDRDALLAALPLDAVKRPAADVTRSFEECRAGPVPQVAFTALAALQGRERSTLSAEDAESLKRASQQAIRQQFSGWAERTYLVLAPTPIPDELAVRIGRFMDRNRQHDFVFLGPAQRPPGLKVRTGLRMEGLDLVTVDPTLHAVAVVRPGCMLDLDAPHATVHA